MSKQEYDAAEKLYRELTEMLAADSSLTTHEIEIALSRVQLKYAHNEFRKFTFNKSGYFTDTDDERKWNELDDVRQASVERLREVCSTTGGQAISYATATYMLVLDGSRSYRPYPQPASDYLRREKAGAYLADAIELLHSLTESERKASRELACLLHFARAACYLARSKDAAAFPELKDASESTDRDVQIISGILSGLLLKDLPDDQFMALSRSAELFDIPRRRFLIPDPVWLHELADALAKYLPDLVPEAPLRTLNLLRAEYSYVLPSFAPTAAAATAANTKVQQS